VFAAGAAQAATVTVNQTVDLTGKETSPGIFFFQQPDFPAFSIDVSQGDHVDWTVNFEPGQSLTLSPHIVNLRIDPIINGVEGVPAGSFITEANTDIELLNGSTVVATLAGLDGTSGALFFSTNNFTGAPVTFTALRGQADVVGFGGALAPTLTFNQARLLIVANAVPEPATWALMILGFGGVGAALRRQRRAATA